MRIVDAFTDLPAHHVVYTITSRAIDDGQTTCLVAVELVSPQHQDFARELDHLPGEPFLNRWKVVVAYGQAMVYMPGQREWFFWKSLEEKGWPLADRMALAPLVADLGPDLDPTTALREPGVLMVRDAPETRRILLVEN